MSKPWIHAISSAEKFGGQPEDYLEIHNLLDSSKAVISDHRHRALTHNTWFISVILEKIFGVTITNSDGKVVSVRDIGEQHVLEDYGNKFIPSAQDFLQEMTYQKWMQNGLSLPESYKEIDKCEKHLNVPKPKDRGRWLSWPDYVPPNITFPDGPKDIYTRD